MEILTMRFPHLSEMIFDHLDNQSLANCNIVSKTWSIYIREQKFYAIRIIKKSVLNVLNKLSKPWFEVFKKASVLNMLNKLSKPWFEVFKKANTDNLLELKKCVDQFLTKQCFNEGCSPLHIAAGVGNIMLYESIHKLAKNKQPRTEWGIPPIVYAIRNDHVKMAEFITQLDSTTHIS